MVSVSEEEMTCKHCEEEINGLKEMVRVRESTIAEMNLIENSHSDLIKLYRNTIREQNARIAELEEITTLHCDKRGELLIEADKQIEDLKTQLKQFEWRPIESAPKDGPRILMLCKHGAIEGCYDGEVGYGYYWRDMRWWATHWMPLPKRPTPPKEEE